MPSGPNKRACWAQRLVLIRPKFSAATVGHKLSDTIDPRMLCATLVALRHVDMP